MRTKHICVLTFQGGASFVYLFRYLSLSCFLVCILQSCGHLLGKGCHIGSFVMFSCAYVTFPNGVLGHVRYLIVSIPDICLLPYFFFYFLGRFFVKMTNTTDFCSRKVSKTLLPTAT